MKRMNKMIPSIWLAFFLLVLSTTSITIATADEVMHKLVIQISDDNPRTYNIALGNAVNLQKYYGMDNIEIEIVAYGPGLDMLTKKNKLASRISSLAMQDITFSACLNTMDQIKKKTGHTPELAEGVSTVRAGVARIIELQEQGYAYVRP